MSDKVYIERVTRELVPIVDATDLELVNEFENVSARFTLLCSEEVLSERAKRIEDLRIEILRRMGEEAT